MLSYVTIAGAALYALLLKHVSTSNLRPWTASIVFCLLQFTLTSFVQSIILNGYNLPLWQLFGLVPVATIVLQFAVAFLVFMKVAASDDSYASWAIWSIAGGIGIFIFVPFITTSLLSQF